MMSHPGPNQRSWTPTHGKMWNNFIQDAQIDQSDLAPARGRHCQQDI